MRVYTRPFASRLGGSSFLSQVTDLPAIGFGRQNSRPFSGAADVADKAPKKLLVSSTSPEIIRGALVSKNTANFRPFPDDRTYLWVIQFYGANPGSVYPLPLEEIAANYRLIENESSERRVYGNIPLPLKNVTKYDISHFVGAIDDGFYAASDALEKAKAGDLTGAQASLAEAISKRDDGKMTLTLLWSLFWINDEVYNDLYERIFKRVDEDVNEAVRVIQDTLGKGAVEKSSANSLQAKIKADVESVAGALSDLAQTLLDDFSVTYWLTVLSNKDLQDYLDVLVVNGAPAEAIEAVRRALDLGKATQLGLEVDLQGIGLSPSEIKGATVLEGLGQGVVKAVGKGLLAALKFVGKIFRSKAVRRIGQRTPIKKGARAARLVSAAHPIAGIGLRQVELALGFGLFCPLISFFVMRAIEKRIKAKELAREAKRAARRAEQEKAAGAAEAAEAAKAAQRPKDILEATRDILNNYKRQLAEVPSSDPVIAGLNDEADLSLAEITTALGESDLLPYILVGAGLFGIGLYFYFKNR